MFEDAFAAIGRDEAGAVEVIVRLHKALQSLASVGDPSMRDAAMRHARMALGRAESKKRRNAQKVHAYSHFCVTQYNPTGDSDQKESHE